MNADEQKQISTNYDDDDDFDTVAVANGVADHDQENHDESDGDDGHTYDDDDYDDDDQYVTQIPIYWVGHNKYRFVSTKTQILCDGILSFPYIIIHVATCFRVLRPLP